MKIGFGMTGQDFLRLRKKLLRNFDGLFAGGVIGSRIERRNARFLGIGVGNISAQSWAAEHDDKSVLFDGFNKNFDSRDFDLSKGNR